MKVLCKKLFLGFFFLGILSSSFLKSVTVHRLESFRQGSTLDCGFYAAYGAHCMVTGKDLTEVTTMLNDKEKFKPLLKKWKEKVKNKDSNYENSGTNIHGDLISSCVLPDLNFNHISIIHSPAHFNKMRDDGFGISQNLFRSVQNFLALQTNQPHAVVYNQGGHWVAYAVRTGERKIYKTDSINTNKESSNVNGRESIENVLFKWFTGNKNLFPGFIGTQLDSLNGLLGQLNDIQKQTDDQRAVTLTSLRAQLDSILIKMILLRLYDDNFFIRELGAAFYKLSKEEHGDWKISVLRKEYLTILRQTVEGFKEYVKANYGDELQKKLSEQEIAKVVTTAAKGYKPEHGRDKYWKGVFVTETQEGDEKHLTAPNDFSTDYAKDIWENISKPTPEIIIATSAKEDEEMPDVQDNEQKNSSVKRKREEEENGKKKRKIGEDKDLEMEDASGDEEEDIFKELDEENSEETNSNLSYNITDYRKARSNKKNLNLRGANLRGAVLRGVNLEGADFTDADLSGANFYKANLTRAKFIRTNLSKTKLKNAYLNHAQMRGAIMRKTVLEKAHLINASFKYVEMSKTNFKRAQLNHAVFAFINDGKRVTFEGAELNYTSFEDVKFYRASFKNAKLKGANLINLKLNNSILDGCDCGGIFVINLSAKKSSLIKTNLDLATFKQANF